MKRVLVLLILLAVLFLSSTPTWAQAAGPSPALAAAPAPAGSGCRLPDLAGLAPGQIAAAALNAGLQMIFVDTPPPVPACPVTFHCNSITGCGIGPLCSVSDIGPCCTTGGAVLCCGNGGDIIVQRCPCRCTGEVCSVVCAQSTNVTFNCS
jgi:hypothetical protein